MRLRISLICGLLACATSAALTAAVGHTGSAETQPAAIPFIVHSGYFVSNKFESTAAASFVVLTDQKAFDKVFGAGFVMKDKSNRLPSDAFDTKIVVSAIKRGNALWTFKVKEVVNDNDVLTIRYVTTETKQDSADYSCPMILSIQKGDYLAVEFIENGKSVNKIKLPPSTSQPSTQDAK